MRNLLNAFVERIGNVIKSLAKGHKVPELTNTNDNDQHTQTRLSKITPAVMRAMTAAAITKIIKNRYGIDLETSGMKKEQVIIAALDAEEKYFLKRRDTL